MKGLVSAGVIGMDEVSTGVDWAACCLALKKFLDDPDLDNTT